MFRISFALFFFIFFAACNSEESKPDVSGIKVEIQLKRFEERFFGVDTNNIAAGLQGTRQEFPEFYPVFTQEFIGEDESNIKAFIQYHRFLYDSLKKKYTDFNWMKKELDDNLRYVKHYYPAYKIPSFFTYIGPFNSPGIAVLQNSIGIGLHQYGGKNFSVYSTPEIVEMYPYYISRRFDKEYMLPNIMKGVISGIYAEQSGGKPLIEQMIEKGKELVLLDKFLPGAPDSVKTGFTTDQLKWTEANEGNIWVQLIETEDIYSIDPAVIQRYIGPAPFTQGFQQEDSPGNLGQWIGWKIVQKFADKNPDLSLDQIVKTPAKVIYNEAKYKPR